MDSEDFAFLRDENTVYLDSACMSLRPDRVVRKIKEYYEEYPGCPGRSAHSVGRRASQERCDARDEVSSLIGCDEENLVFTSGTTEGINLIAHSGDFDRVVVSDRAHNSNLLPWQEHVDSVSVVSTKGGFDASTLKDRVSPGDLVSITETSNLDGYRLPVEDIVDVAHEVGAFVLVDGAQAVPHRPVDVQGLGADYYVFSGHKMLGPSGTGGLFVSERGRRRIKPFMLGGGGVTDATVQGREPKPFPHNFEAGLPNMAGLVGLGEAAKYLSSAGMGVVRDEVERLTSRLDEVLRDTPGVEVVGRAGLGIRSFRVGDMSSHQVASLLDEQGIAVRAGQHCLHHWFNEYEEEPTVRASLHCYNDEDDIVRFEDALETIAYLSR